MIRAVLFDVGGTLHRVHASPELAIQFSRLLLRRLEEAGIRLPIGAQALAPLLRENAEDYKHRSEQSQTELPAARIWNEFYLRDFQIGEERLAPLAEELSVLYDAVRVRNEPRPHMRETIQTLHDMGLVQGVAEFLPISSSGHLAIAEHLLNMQGASNVPDFFDVLLHLGTLFAVFAAYWDDIRDMVVEFFTGIGDLAHHRTPNPVPPARRLILLIIVGTLPLFVMVPFRRFFSSLGDNMYFIGGALIFTGILLFVSDRVRHGRKSEKTATLLDALLVGVGQAIALCPGISRSGMTITAGCFAGFERKFAVRFAFLLSIPAVLGANILTLKDALETNIDWASVPAYLIGVVVAAVSGYASIRLLRYVADKGRFGAFAYYCWAAGALTLLLTILH